MWVKVHLNGEKVLEFLKILKKFSALTSNCLFQPKWCQHQGGSGELYLKIPHLILPLKDT